MLGSEYIVSVFSQNLNHNVIEKVFLNLWLHFDSKQKF